MTRLVDDEFQVIMTCSEHTALRDATLCKLRDFTNFDTLSLNSEKFRFIVSYCNDIARTTSPLKESIIAPYPA